MTAQILLLPVVLRPPRVDPLVLGAAGIVAVWVILTAAALVLVWGRK